ncbi:hypothetical protein [Paenibacillus sp. NPDC055715]
MNDRINTYVSSLPIRVGETPTRTTNMILPACCITKCWIFCTSSMGLLDRSELGRAIACLDQAGYVHFLGVGARACS